MQAGLSSRVLRWLLVALALALVLWFITAAGTALFPFILGVVLAYVLLPLVNGLQAALPRPVERQRRRTLAIFLVYLVGLGLVALVLAFLVPALAAQFTHLLDLLPTYVERIQMTLQSWTSQYREAVPEGVQTWVDQQVQAAVVGLQDVGRGLLLNTVRVVFSTVSAVIGLLIVPVWLFFVLKDQPRALPAFLGLFPPDVRTVVRDMLFIMDYVLSRYIRAQLFLGLVVGLMTFVGLTAMNIPFAPVLAVISGVGELIPIIGPILGAIPGLLVVLATDPSRLPVIALLYWAVQLVENNLLVPRIQGSAVQLPPPIIMILLVGAGEAAGVWGMLAAVPLAAILRDVFVYLYRRAGGLLPPTPTEEALESRTTGETAHLFGEGGDDTTYVGQRAPSSARSEEGVTIPPGP